MDELILMGDDLELVRAHLTPKSYSATTLEALRRHHGQLDLLVVKGALDLDYNPLTEETLLGASDIGAAAVETADTRKSRYLEEALF